MMGYNMALKWFLWQLAHANLLLAFSTAGAVYVAGLVLNLPENPAPAAILFLVTFAIYNFNRHTDRREDEINHPGRVAFIKKYGKILVILSVFAYLLAIWLSLYGGSGAQLLVMVPLVTLVLYSLRWFPKNGDTSERLKEIFVIKNVVVSAAWGGTVTFLPVLYFEAPISAASLYVFVFFFLRFFINTVVFDLRDIAGDSKENINTIPVVLGYTRTRNVLQLLNAFIGLFFVLAVFFGIMPLIAVLLVFSTIYSFIYLTYLKSKENVHFVCDVVVDGEYFVLAVFYYLLLAYNAIHL